MVNTSSLVKDSDLEIIAAAVQKQILINFAPAWDILPATVKFYPAVDVKKIPGYAYILNILDDDTSEEGALGWHTETNDKIQGFILCKPILDNGGGVLTSTTPYTVSATVSHEILEIIGDRFCGSFCVGPQVSGGNLYCQEMCDAVEDQSYTLTVNGTNVSVSNFLFPSAFNSQATSINEPFDFLKGTKAPFTMTAGGYQIVATISNEGQITPSRLFGENMPQWRRDTKMHKLSRSSRRSK